MKKIGIIGASGNLGNALKNLFLLNGYKNSLLLSDKISEDVIENSNEDVIENSNILFLCVKPKDMKEVLEQFKDKKDKLIISCVASVSTSNIKKNTQNLKIARIMPNLPIAYGKGAITYFSNDLDDKDLLFLEKILKGPMLLKVNDENLIDVSTILTGSMPAFIAKIAENHLIFGEKFGFTKEESLKLYSSTVEGTLEMLKNNSSEKIISNVCSPGGVTEKGIKFLKNNKLDSIILDSLLISYNSLKNKN